ncbi:Hypothetical predicted protein [Mytilus galloprovincialis]|uniref:Uncharacterized protein n=1 Tax=Mytilus galloprovincialis TaxID=29158 RepID=A0A8B6CDP7_MYTGA|nr:Hypothetical predicted protein [Mytilus galloprovincialis]
MASSQGVDDMTLEKQTEDTEIEKSDMACSINYSQCLVPKGIDIAKYILQRDSWPREGKHILAQYDDRSVIVYQAFNPAIAKYAVQNQRFGGEQFSYERMSWIKTNFLWMMYRCGWASKNNQQRVLAVRISRRGFEKILANAFTVKFQREQKLQTDQISVRLQWDPDHSPTYDKLPRKAIQLGLKGEILKTYGTEWIQSITDITDFVKSQKKVLDREGQKDLMTPKERVYNVLDCNTCSRIDLDVFEEGQCRNFGIHSIVKKAEEAAQTGKSRGYAFVEYKTLEDAVKAKEHLHGGHVEGKEITVEFSKSNFKGQDNQDSGTSKPDHWKCQVSGCGNMNFPIRKRCSKCNSPRTKGHNESNTQDGGVPDSAAEQCVRSAGTAEQQGRDDTSGSGKGGRFTEPEDLHIPHGMDVPDTEEQHLAIEKTAKFVAANGIQMEIMIKSKQGNNPKLTFLNLHDPLNFYYNHMVKMIKAGKYTPTDQTKGGDSIGINVPQNTS